MSVYLYCSLHSHTILNIAFIEWLPQLHQRDNGRELSVGSCKSGSTSLKQEINGYLPLKFSGFTRYAAFSKEQGSVDLPPWVAKSISLLAGTKTGLQVSSLSSFQLKTVQPGTGDAMT